MSGLLERIRECKRLPQEDYRTKNGEISRWIQQKLGVPYIHHGDDIDKIPNPEHDGKGAQTILSLLEILEQQSQDGHYQLADMWRPLLNEGAVEVVCEHNNDDPLRLNERVFYVSQNDRDWI